ncbi:MAG: NADH-quinone oxidoreductase subunit NuoB [Myxococcales bacterium]|nr:NADH-quinone oxidoreductase subunit NuoB [Myxococcales bacterium]
MTTTTRAAERYLRQWLARNPSVEKAVGWGRKLSLQPYVFATSCCGLEVQSARVQPYDARLGVGFPVVAPQQADLLVVAGSISWKQLPILQSVYRHMPDPKHVLAFGVCASSGGLYQNYATAKSIEKFLPVDIHVPGCPPRPEALLDALRMLGRSGGRKDAIKLEERNEY